jgi:DNA-binding CsgD family transcriptional regulator
MAQSSDERMARLVEQLQQNPGLAEQLPSQEGEMVRDALDGQSVYEIAQNHTVSEETVWRTLSVAARMASGQAVHQVETGGFGSDTDPGVTGGYGETGFGSLSADMDPGDVDNEQGLGFSDVEEQGTPQEPQA